MLCGKRIDLRVTALVLAALLIGSTPAAAGPLPDAFLGKFRGSVTGGAGEISGDFDMMSAAKSNGFIMSWPKNGGTGFEATKDRENVFHAPPKGKLIEGGPAFWARLADGKLLVYSMRIDSQGGYDIYTFVYTPVENGLDLLIYHLRSGSEPLESRARLVRHGG